MFTRKLIYGFGSLLIGVAPLLAQIRLTPADPVADRLVAEALQKTPEIRSATASVEAAPPGVAITATRRRTNSAASVGSRSI